MQTTETISALAAFATLKGLNDTKKYNSPYQILAEFITYIVCTQNLYSFSFIEMKNKLKAVFDFDIPEAVVKSATKSLPYIVRIKKTCTVKKGDLPQNDTFQDINSEAKIDNASIIDKLILYITERISEEERVVPKDAITQELIAFLVDNHEYHSGPYYKYISEFVLKHEQDKDTQRILSNIREGSILYVGLNSNINETGSLTKKLTLFLGTEILFSLVGFNGEIYKQLAQDFFTQVKNANKVDSKILLCFFPEIKREIEDFFMSAESIVSGKESMFDTPAMQSIVNGCKTINDVLVKKADFYYTLQYTYGIVEYNGVDYYAERNHIYNLESTAEMDEQTRDSLRLISHINVLRKGQVFTTFINAEYLVVTNSGTTLRLSRESIEDIKTQKNMDYVCEYAVSLDRVTNVLWYKLGGGFGKKEYPKNADVVLKARRILSACVSKNISDEYNKSKEQYQTGEITKEQLVARIITLRKKPILPEELEGDVIEDIMDFSLEYISRFEEEVSFNKMALQEKELEIKQIEAESEQRVQAKNQEIAEKDQVILAQQDKNSELQSELEKYRKQELQNAEKKQHWKNMGLLLWSFLWKATVFIVIMIGSNYIRKKFQTDLIADLVNAGNFIGFGLGLFKTIKHDYTKCFPKNKDLGNGN